MRILDIENPKDRALGLRICELVGLNPINISADGFTIHRNHITYQGFPPAPRTSDVINKRTGSFVRKTRIIRNPLPTSAWRNSK